MVDADEAQIKNGEERLGIWLSSHYAEEGSWFW